jgi:hypothetical protein
MANGFFIDGLLRQCGREMRRATWQYIPTDTELNGVDQDEPERLVQSSDEFESSPKNK